MRVILLHPESPGVYVMGKPCLLRRLRLIRSPFATYGEVIRMYKRAIKRQQVKR